MLQIHPNARTTPAVRAEIARSDEPSGVLAKRYGVSAETVRKWRKRGPEDCLDRSARPHRLPWKATEEERAVVCALRRSTRFALDDLTFVVSHFLPHLNRDAVYRILKAEGLGRLPAPSRSAKPDGHDLGFVHLDVKHLPKLRDRNGVARKRYLFVAIDRCSRWVHLAVKDDETQASAVAFLQEAVRAFPFQVTHVLTDRGSCFTADGFEAACRTLGVAHRTTRPYTPRTAWSSASTAGYSARCWASRSTAIAIWRSCCMASTKPTMPVASACWAAPRPTRRCDDGWRPIPVWPARAMNRGQTHASDPKPSWSSKPPRRSRIQTAKVRTH